MKPFYKRILLKLSGEGLMGNKEYGMEPSVVEDLAQQVKKIHSMGVDVAIVVGGGNIFRGSRETSKAIETPVAHQIGMLATVMNALYLQSHFKSSGIDAKVFSSLNIPNLCDLFVYRDAITALENRKVLIFAGGTGNPYFTTDTGSALRASEMGCDVIMKATQVDGVYDKDPNKYSDAVRYDSVSFDEVIAKEIKVMDISAFALARQNNIPIMVFSQGKENSIVDAVCKKGNFTIVENK